MLDVTVQMYGMRFSGAVSCPLGSWATLSSAGALSIMNVLLLLLIATELIHAAAAHP
jgi:hypothetical protein